MVQYFFPKLPWSKKAQMQVHWNNTFQRILKFYLYEAQQNCISFLLSRMINSRISGADNSIASYPGDRKSLCLWVPLCVLSASLYHQTMASLEVRRPQSGIDIHFSPYLRTGVFPPNFTLYFRCHPNWSLISDRVLKL